MGGCGVRLLEMCVPQDIMVYCPECLGVNVYHNSKEPVAFLAHSDCLDVALLDHYTDSEKKRLSAVIQWAESFYHLPPQRGTDDYNSRNEKPPDTQRDSLSPSTSENYNALCVPYVKWHNHFWQPMACARGLHSFAASPPALGLRNLSSIGWGVA